VWSEEGSHVDRVDLHVPVSALCSPIVRNTLVPPFGGPQLRLAASSPAWKDALAEADDGIDNYRGGIDVGRHCQPQHLGHPDIE
jgi:hypothetical protein